MSGGGAQSALVGTTGDSEPYEPYLEQIGAVQGVSDAVYGSMDWCPITNLDSADEAYEWMMGVTRSGLSEDEQAISNALAVSFADYINQAGIKDKTGNVLTLEESADGIYQAGSYYNYILGVIEESLNHFLSDTEFPSFPLLPEERTEEWAALAVVEKLVISMTLACRMAKKMVAGKWVEKAPLAVLRGKMVQASRTAQKKILTKTRMI